MKRPDANDPRSLRYRFRQRRFRRIEAMIRELLATQDEVTILDVGGRGDYWERLPADLRPHVAITLVNFEAELEEFAQDSEDLRITSTVGDGCHMPQYADDSFDIAHSNSVIEHVGSLTNMARFAAETRRIGRHYYVQAPYLWFPLEPHFGVPLLHWLPGPTRAQLTHRFSVGFSERIESYEESLAEADFINLVDRTLMKKLFPEADHERERFALLTKSLIAVSAPAAA